MSQGSTTAANTPIVPTSSPAKPAATPATDTINDISAVKKEIKPALPWSDNDADIYIKTFTGYTIRLNGWIRDDIKKQQEKDRAGEALRKAKEDEEELQHELKEKEAKANEEKESENKDETVENNVKVDLSS